MTGPDHTPAHPALRRVAIAARGNPRDPATSSGTPAGLFRGLAEAGVEGVPLHAGLPRRVERVARRARLDLRDAAFLHETVARRRLAAAGPVDGVIQWGTEFRLAPGVPYVTFEDQTLAQALRAYEYPDLATRGQRAIDRWFRRQRALYAEAVACCTTSHWAAQSLVDDYGLDPGRVHVVGVGRNRDVEPPPDGRDWGVPRFLFVGAEWERKNGPRLLRAFARLRAECPDATLDVVGGHPPIEQPGVRTHGFLRLDDAEHRARLATLFQEATCFVMPSLYEPSAIVHAEAAGAGLASIGSAAGGSRTLIGDAGVLVDPQSDDALTGALRELADPGRARELSERALARAPLLTWRAVVERLLGALTGRPVDDL